MHDVAPGDVFAAQYLILQQVRGHCEQKGFMSPSEKGVSDQFAEEN